MRWITVLLIMVLGGCQSLPGVASWSRIQAPSIWPLWERYQQCRTAADPAQLHRAIEHLEQGVTTGVTPPAWVAALGIQVTPQPLRTSVDPAALGAACTVRAAMLFQATGLVDEARALYHRVLARYDTQELVYYREQAIEALRQLDAQVVAFRPGSIGR